MVRAFTLIAFIFVSLQSVFAADFIIEDTSGVVRHASEVESNVTLRFSVTDSQGNPINGATVRITTKDGAMFREAIAVDGVVEFSEIPAGNWVVSTETSKLLFTQISVSELGSGNALASLGGQTGSSLVGDSAVVGAGTGTGTTLAVVGTGLLAVGGITGLVVAIDESGSNSKTELSPAD